VSYKNTHEVSMWQLGRVFVSAESLVRLQAVFVVVAMPLQLQEEQVTDPVGGIPRMADCNLFVGTVSKLLSLESIVLHIVGCLQ